MAIEKSGFFDSYLVDGQPDIAYTAEDFGNYFSKFISDGVYPDPANQLKVKAGAGMSVVVVSGNAFIEGVVYSLIGNKELSVSPNTLPYPRTDKIVCVYNRSGRSITTKVVEGVSSTLPVNDGSVHELVLAEYELPAGASSMADVYIKDRRGEKPYCGFVTGVVKQIDTTDLFQQYEEEFRRTLDNIKDDPIVKFDARVTKLEEKAVVIRTGTEPPQDSVGEDGDFYARYEP